MTVKAERITRTYREVIERFEYDDKNKITFWLSRIEKFDPQKVAALCIKSGAGRETAGEIARRVASNIDEDAKMVDVRPHVYSLLRKADPEAAKRFIEDGEIYVSTSKETFEKFDRESIIRSLIRETGLSEQDAEGIAMETERFIRNLNLDFVSSQLIREMVSVTLLRKGFGKERNRYTRIGLPVYDTEKLINAGSNENSNLQYNPETVHKLIADSVLRQYTLLKILPSHLAESHMKGQIHVHDLDYFCTRPFCFSHDLRFFLRNGLKVDGTGNHTSIAGPAKKAEVAVLHAAKILAAAQTNCSGGQGLSYFNTHLAPYVRGLPHKKVKQLMQMFVYEMSQMYVARGGQTVFSSIDIDMDVPRMFKDVPVVEPGGKINDGSTYSDYYDEIRTIYDALIDVYLEGDYRGRPFNFPKIEVQVYPDKIDEAGLLKASELSAKFGTPYYIINQPYMPEFACYQCCSYLMPLDTCSTDDDLYNGTIRGGALQVVTINLPQIAYKANGNDNAFFGLLRERIMMAGDVHMLKNKVVHKNLRNGLLPFLNQKVNDGERYLEPDKQSYVIGVLGINEMAKAHTGGELHDGNESWMFGLKVMKFMKDTVAELRASTGMNFSLARTPAESTAQRFANIDRKAFNGKAVYQGDSSGSGIYYTNSFHVRPSADVPLWKRLKIEGAFHPLTDGGAMSHIFLGDARPDPVAIAELTKKISKNTAIQYMAYTKDLTICNNCGHIVSALRDACPSCSGTDIQQWSRITGYYQNIKGWNKAKIAELKDRQRHSV